MYLQHHQHKSKAVLGITSGLAVAALTALKCYDTWVPGVGSMWGFMILLALPIIAWGCSHLALGRGYPTSVAYSLFIVSVFAATAIGFNQNPETIGVAFVFVGLMPPVVLVSLPVRFGAMRRSGA